MNFCPDDTWARQAYCFGGDTNVASALAMFLYLKEVEGVFDDEARLHLVLSLFTCGRRTGPHKGITTRHSRLCA